MNYQYITNDAIITEFKRGKRKLILSDADLKSYIDIDIKKLLKIYQKDFKIAIVRNINRSIKLPENLFKITQVLYLPLKDYSTSSKTINDLKDIGIELSECLCTKPTGEKKCKEERIQYDLVNYSCDNKCLLDFIFQPTFLTYSDIQVYNLNKNQLMQNKSVAYLMRPKTNNFYNINYHLSGCIDLNADTVLSYDIEDNTKMNVNIDDGFILISYLANKVDDKGYLLIPDEPFTIDALLASLEEREIKQKMLANPNVQNYRGIWRDLLSIKTSKLRAAESELKKISKDKLSIILESFWDTNMSSRGINNEYKPAINMYPDF